MNKYFSSFFIIVLCVPLFMWCMDPLENARSICIGGDPCCRIIHIRDVEEIAFLGNTELVVPKKNRTPCLINLDSKKCSYFSRTFIPFRGSLSTDQSKKRVLFSREDDQAKIRIYDSISKEFSSARIIYDDQPDKYFPVCFDECKPTSILVQKGTPTSIVSYDYNTQEISSEDFLSEGFKDNSLQVSKYIGDLRLGINGIVGLCEEGVKAYYKLPEPVCRHIKMKDVILTGRSNYICAPDFSFIVHYGSFFKNRVLKSCPKAAVNICYISYAHSDQEIMLRDEGSNPITPCSMVMHPNNKVFAVMSAGNRIVR